MIKIHFSGPDGITGETANVSAVPRAGEIVEHRQIEYRVSKVVHRIFMDTFTVSPFYASRIVVHVEHV